MAVSHKSILNSIVKIVKNTSWFLCFTWYIILYNCFFSAECNIPLSHCDMSAIPYYCAKALNRNTECSFARLCLIDLFFCEFFFEKLRTCHFAPRTQFFRKIPPYVSSSTRVHRWGQGLIFWRMQFNIHKRSCITNAFQARFVRRLFEVQFFYGFINNTE